MAPLPFPSVINSLVPAVYPVPEPISPLMDSFVIPPSAVIAKLFALADMEAPEPDPVSVTRPVGAQVNPYPPLISCHPVIFPVAPTDVTVINTSLPPHPVVVR